MSCGQKNTSEEVVFGSGIGIFPALCASRLASLVAHVGENSPPDCFLPQTAFAPSWFEPLYNLNKNKNHPIGWFCFWQRDRDSNPNKQSQSLSCYRYTIPLRTMDIILLHFPIVNSLFKIFWKKFLITYFKKLLTF